MKRKELSVSRYQCIVIARKRNLHRLKAGNLTFPTVQLCFSDDSYTPVLEGSENQGARPKLKVIITFLLDIVRKRAYHHLKVKNLSFQMVVSTFSNDF